MKKIFTFLLLFHVNLLFGDILFKSLNSMLHEKDKPAMVNLEDIYLNPKIIRIRPPKTVVAIINRQKIIKKVMDKYLKSRTEGKVSDFDKLPKKQKIRLVKEMSLPKLILSSAKRELSTEEKNKIYQRVWMQKQASIMNITDKKAKAVYTQIQQSRDLPPFKNIKDRLKMQIVERAVVGNLMKNLKIKVY